MTELCSSIVENVKVGRRLDMKALKPLEDMLFKKKKKKSAKQQTAAFVKLVRTR